MRPFSFGENHNFSLKKSITPLTPQIGFLTVLCSFQFPHLFVVEFIEILSDRNKINFQANRIDSSSRDSFVPTVTFYDSKCSFGLDGSIHSEQSTMDTFQIFYHFFMHSGKFMVDSHRSVFIGLFTFVCIWTSATVFTLVYFFLSSVLIPFYMLAVL